MRTTGARVGKGVGEMVAVEVGLGPPGVIVTTGVEMGMGKPDGILQAHITRIMPSHSKFFFEFMRNL